MYDDKEIVCLLRVSRKVQQNENQEYLVRNAFPNANITWFKEHGVSGKTYNKDRPQLLAATKQAIKMNVPFVVANISRLGRDLAEVSAWYRDNVMSGKLQLIALDQPGLEQETAGIFFTIQQTERIKISQRTKAALDRKQQEIKEKGFFISKAGNRIERLGNTTKANGLKGAATNKKNAQEFAQKYLPIITHLKSQGLTIKQIAEDLNAKSIPTARGGLWHTSSVMNILKRAA